MCEQSDVVALGTIPSLSRGNPTTFVFAGRVAPGHVMSGSLTVAEVLKGATPTDVHLEFTAADERTTFGSVPVGSVRLYFLKHAGEHFTFTDPYYPSIVGARGAALKGSVIDKVAATVARVMTVSEASRSERVEALGILGSLRSDESITGLLSSLQSPDRSLRLSAAGNLLRLNDLRGLSPAVAALMASDGMDAQANYDLIRGVMGLKDPAGAPLVIQLLGCPDKFVRRAAVSGLISMGSRSAIAGLGKALYDADVEVRESAVGGLADLTNQGEWHPSMDLYRADESKYLTYWKDWIRRHPG
jgi:hypothetical protein